jgi:hypothetical protein
MHGLHRCGASGTETPASPTSIAGRSGAMVPDQTMIQPRTRACIFPQLSRGMAWAETCHGIND